MQCKNFGNAGVHHFGTMMKGQKPPTSVNNSGAIVAMQSLNNQALKNTCKEGNGRCNFVVSKKSSTVFYRRYLDPTRTLILSKLQKTVIVSSHC
jgi:hypothetical protein